MMKMNPMLFSVYLIQELFINISSQHENYTIIVSGNKSTKANVFYRFFSFLIRSNTGDDEDI